MHKTLKDIKDLNKRYTMFMGRKTQYSKDIIYFKKLSLKLMVNLCYFNTEIRYFLVIYKLILKCICKKKRQE